MIQGNTRSATVAFEYIEQDARLTMGVLLETRSASQNIEPGWAGAPSRTTFAPITGIATSIGVESTARAAHEHNYQVTIATDAVSDLDPDTHRNSVEKVFPRLAETGTTAEILDLLAKA